MIQEILRNLQGNLTKSHDLLGSFSHYLGGRVDDFEER